MNNADFVDALRVYVRDAGIKDVISKLKSPPSRKVTPEMKNLSE